MNDGSLQPPAPGAASEIAEGLRLIRLRQRRMGHVLLGLVPFVLAAGYAGSKPFEFMTSLIVAAVIYGALLLAYSLRLAFTECPRCHGLYHYNWWLDPWTPKCLHCRLPREA